MIYWLTGQPGSGKTTIGKLLCEIIANSFLIDGDDLRKIFINKDYSEKGRKKNIMLAQKMAHMVSSSGLIPIVSLVSPYRDLRESFKKEENVIEIYLTTSEDRGKTQFHVLYYEPPLENFIHIDTDLSIDETMLYLLKELKLKNNEHISI